MQFTKENAEKVMAGTKTQTRRIVKEGEFLTLYFNWDVMQEVPTVFDAHRRIKWQVGRTYAVCPGRGKPAIGRVKLLSIRKEKLQGISVWDCAAELGDTVSGDGLLDAFLSLDFADLWNSIAPKGKRWADSPDVWVLTFEKAEG